MFGILGGLFCCWDFLVIGNSILKVSATTRCFVP